MAPKERIEAAGERSPLVRAAYAKAREAHAGQVRNGSGGMAYVEHPVAVAALLDESGYGEEAVAAGLLHDVVEDSDTTLDELREDFGQRVAGLVGALTDDEEIESYRQRKAEHRERVGAAGDEALAVYAADKLTNARTVGAALDAEGDAVRSEFKVPLELKAEIWEADLELLREQAPQLPFLDDLDEALSDLRVSLAAAAPPRG
ncbi:MAG TPA: HD domain-containing protein [Solirubrobacterales bacterium]|nr:HD domain-containing protein [Solirubrobacterales bacterium]